LVSRLKNLEIAKLLGLLKIAYAKLQLDWEKFVDMMLVLYPYPKDTYTAQDFYLGDE
jgi:hypothetical protein